jgi:FolB domain-containing protein
MPEQRGKNMTDQIHIEQLELKSRVGVTESERTQPQRLTVSITLWPLRDFRELDDDLAKTINYSAVCREVKKFTKDRADKLIETLADSLASHLLDAFPTRKIQIELRKFILSDVDYVSVRLIRARLAS